MLMVRYGTAGSNEYLSSYKRILTIPTVLAQVLIAYAYMNTALSTYISFLPYPFSKVTETTKIALLHNIIVLHSSVDDQVFFKPIQ